MNSRLSSTRMVALFATLVLSVACDGDDGDDGGGDGVATGGQSDAGGACETSCNDSEAAQACVDRINAFRATEGLSPLERWTEAETCTSQQAQSDAQAGGAHVNFGQCGESAQNTCPGWPSSADVVEGCLQAMWDEGPGEDFSAHGHYINMSNPQYTRVACGFHEMSGGSVWSNQNFQ